MIEQDHCQHGPDKVSELSTAATQDTDHRRSRTLEHLGCVPIHPGPLLELLNGASDDPNVVIQALERCPTLAARVLAVTNSAGFGLAHPIHALPRAVIHLGARRARTIALAYSLRLLSEQFALPPEVLETLWTTNLYKAAAARLAADQIDPRHAEAAYVLALIQDLGLPMLMAVDLPFYQSLRPSAKTGSWSEQELAHFGIDHAEVGARLLEQWHASSEACHSVLHHHQPPLDTEADLALARLPGFIASLLPHLEEPITGDQQQWMLTLHAKFFSSAYSNPESFLCAACEVANPLRGNQYTRRQALAVITQRLPEAVAADSVHLVDQLCRLENALGRERQNANTLRYEAFTDPLTHVLNRRGFSQLAQRRLDDARHNRIGVCCLVLDLDGFKQVNDQFGHDGGDLLLQGLGRVLCKSVDRSDLIGRLGGDEFALLISVDQLDQARCVVERLCRVCQAECVRVDGQHTLALSLSLGAVFCQPVGPDVMLDDLIAAADEAMYQRKRAGKSGLVFTTYIDSSDDDPPPGPHTN